MGQLYPHNQKIYDKIIKSFKYLNKVAVVQATGTGKGYLAAELINTLFKNTITLILAPNKDILLNYENSLGIKNNGRVLMLTYPGLLALYKKDRPDGLSFEFLKKNVGFLIVDEFHRMGAEQWGMVVCDLIDFLDTQNKKILGLSATPIRYNDSSVLNNPNISDEDKILLSKNRDMVDEIFEGNVIHGLSLEEAVYCGVLPEFLYILLNYGYDDDLQSYMEQYSDIEESYGVDSVAAKKCKKIIEELSKFSSSDKNVQDYLFKLTNKLGENQKWIVFCDSVMQLEEIDDSISIWFNKPICKYNDNIDGCIKIYSVSSKQSDVENLENLDAFYKNSDGIHVIKCINKLNEGAHVDDITGIFMMRRTLSPIVYMQQLGRALSSGKKGTPIVFDLMNNIDNVRKVLAGEDEMVNSLLRSQKRLKGFNSIGFSSDVLSSQELGFYRKNSKERNIRIINASGKLINLFDEMGSLLNNRTGRNIWTKEEINILVNYYPLGGSERVMFELKNRGLSIRTLDAITQQARKYKLSNNLVNEDNLLKWMPSEDELILNFFKLAREGGVKGLNIVASDLHRYYMKHRNPKQILSRYEWLRVNGKTTTVNYENNGKRWSENDLYALKKSIELKIPIYLISMELGRSISSIESKSQEIGCVRQPRNINTVKIWSKEDKAFLVENYYKLTPDELVAHLGCSKNALAKAYQRYSLELMDKRKKEEESSSINSWSSVEKRLFTRLLIDEVDWERLCDALKYKSPKEIKRQVERFCKEHNVANPYIRDVKYKEI